MTTIPPRARGMSLIEVLVGILLISFGLLGLISLTSRNIQFSVGAEDSQRAALLAHELANTITMASTNVPGDIVLNKETVSAWQAVVKNPADRGLPNGSGTVTAAGRIARITVQWRPPQASDLTMNTYVTDLVLP
jgi:type IV pilus assembly protein PilV